MLRLLRRVFIYILLLIYGRGKRDSFQNEVKRHCKKRRNRRHVPGITEELDELLTIPNNCRDDISFVGFTNDAKIACFRIAKVVGNEYSALSMDLPGLGRFIYSDSRNLGVGAGPLQFEVLVPMKRWRIRFRGRVERYSESAGSEILHATVSLFWQCLADPFDHWTCLSRWQLAGNLSNLAWNLDAIKMLLRKESMCYEQWGDMWGTVEIEGQQTQTIRLKGFRKHRIERIGCTQDEVVVSHHVIEENGYYYITNGGTYRRDNRLNETFGYLTLPVGARWITDQPDLKLVENNEQFREVEYPIRFNAKGNSFDIMKSGLKKIPLKCQSAAFDTIVCFAMYTMNGELAYGISVKDRDMSLNTSEEEQASEEMQATPVSNNLIVRLDDGNDRHKSFVGGKAANLSKLSRMGYRVPKGFCVTTQCFRLQIESQGNSRKAVDKIEHEYLKGEDTSQRSKDCTRCVQLLQDTEVNIVVTRAIAHELREMFGADFEDNSFAVRSSALSEDGTESSYAGQMESYLGVKGLANIQLAVRKCWASSFSERVIEYRRLNGQPLIEDMAVVIQEMVDADVAGVLFTNEPVSGNTSTMVINAAPGLGEIVVSGKCNPDTIKVRRGNGLQDDFEITSTDIGKSRFKLVCSPDNGVTEVQTDAVDRLEPCISVDRILELCEIGQRIEETMGFPQDIEWAISKGQIYLLQTRPISSLNEDTDDDLLHEFDSPVAMNSECVTTHHVGELFAGCVSTLTLDLACSGISEAMVRFSSSSCGAHFSKYADKAIMTYTNRPHLGMTAFSLAADGLMQDKESIDIAMAGRIIEEYPLSIIQKYKGGPVSVFESLRSFIYANFILAPRLIKWFAQWIEGLEKFSLEKDASNATKLYQAIDANLQFYYQAWRAYAFVTTRSFIPYAIMYKMLRGKNATVTNEINADMAVLLTDCPNVLTASLPRSLEQLAREIAESDLRDTFVQLPDEFGHICLINSESRVGSSYLEFLKVHGHRCIREIEFREKAWESDPRTLMRTLKLMIKSPSQGQVPNEETKSNREIVAKLKTPLPLFQRLFLQTVLLNKAKAGIADREAGKSAVIKSVDMFKRTYRKLAEMMVSEGRLPENDLLFFLTHNEIGSLLESRSAALVRKARRRKHVLHQQEAIRYPRVNLGLPVPLLEEKNQTRLTSLRIVGMPVGKGVAMGRACVLQTLEDADNIQAGDILICPFTDVGWSPYFPLITGLVTEMGGLISHGAVVAREVGIPCVVNADEATRLFATGDTVRIDGLAGVIERID